MKRFLLLLMSVWLSGCDGNDALIERTYRTYCVWQNDSDHRISISIPDYTHDETGEAEDPQEILPGKYIVRITYTEGEPLSFYKGIELLFDDGPYGGKFPLASSSSPNPYDLCQSSNYRSMETFRDGQGELSFRWSYTFTNADYEAAVARGPMTDN